MFYVVIMSNWNGEKSQKTVRYCIAWTQNETSQCYWELFTTNYFLDHSQNTCDITVNGVGVYVFLHIPGMVQHMEMILISLLQ